MFGTTAFTRSSILCCQSSQVSLACSTKLGFPAVAGVADDGGGLGAALGLAPFSTSAFAAASGTGVAPGRGAVVAKREEDHIEQETEHLIRFVTRTDDDVDGVDFKVSERPEIIRFVLEIDGRPRPAEIEVGRVNFVPNQNPLVVRLR